MLDDDWPDLQKTRQLGGILDAPPQRLPRRWPSPFDILCHRVSATPLSPLLLACLVAVLVSAFPNSHSQS